MLQQRHAYFILLLEVSNQPASPEQLAPSQTWASYLVTWRCHSILVFGLKFTDSEQHHLDGPNEYTCQATVEDDIEEEDLNCKRKQRRIKSSPQGSHISGQNFQPLPPARKSPPRWIQIASPVCRGIYLTVRLRPDADRKCNSLQLFGGLKAWAPENLEIHESGFVIVKHED